MNPKLAGILFVLAWLVLLAAALWQIWKSVHTQ